MSIILPDVHQPQSPILRAATTLVLSFLLLLLPVITSRDAALYADRVAAWPHGHGCDGSLNSNCGMDNFNPIPQGAVSGSVPSGWTPFVLSGSLEMKPSPDTYWGAPSLQMWSDGGTFVAGVFTQVGGLTPGATYFASIGWGAPNEPDAFGRRLGIDPAGGTDPNSPNVVWGQMWRGPGKVLNDSDPGYPNIDVSAVARASTVTVFVWVDHNYSTGPNQIFIDAVGLYQNTDVPVVVATAAPQPAAVAPQPAPTKPRAAAPTKRPPTATATRTPTRTATASPTATATETRTPSPTATYTLTPTPEDTATPTVTPTSTLPPHPRATAAPVKTAVASATATPQRGLLFGGIGALAGAGLLSIGVVLRRRN